MPTKAVRLTDLLVGANSLGYLVMVPGASVLIRQNGVALVGSAGPGTPAVFSDNNKTAMTNPVPTGVTPGTAGVDTAGRLVVYLNPGKGYDVQATVGNVTTTAPLPDVGVDVEDVQAPIEAGTYAETPNGEPATAVVLVRGITGEGAISDRAAIQSGLNLASLGPVSSVVRVPKVGAGICAVDAPLVVYSDTRLILEDGVTITRTAGYPAGNLLRNAADSTTASGGMDGAVTAASTAVTSTAFTAGRVGQDFTIWGPGPQFAPLWGPMHGTVTGVGTGTLNSRTEAATTQATTTPTVICPGIRDSDLGQPVSGTGIPANAYIGAVYPTGYATTAGFTVFVAGAPTFVTAAGATTITIGGGAVNTVSAMYVAVGPRDRNIVIEGGDWNNAGNTGGPKDGYGIRIRRCDGFEFRGARHRGTNANQATYALDLGDVTHYKVDDHHMAVARDGVHIEGPAFHGKISNLSGRTGDDMVGLTVGNYAAYQDTFGPIIDVLVDDIDFDNGSSGVCVIGNSQIFPFDDITLSNLRGDLGKGSIVRAIDDALMPVGTRIESLTLDNISATNNGSQSDPINIDPTICKTLRMRRMLNRERKRYIHVYPGCVINHLSIDGLDATKGSTDAAIIIEGQVDRLTTANMDVALSTLGKLVQITSVATVPRWDAINVSAIGASQGFFLLSQSTTVPLTVNLVNSYLITLAYGFQCSGPVTLNLVNVQTNGITAYLYDAVAATSLVAVNETNVTKTGTAAERRTGSLTVNNSTFIRGAIVAAVEPRGLTDTTSTVTAANRAFFWRIPKDMCQRRAITKLVAYIGTSSGSYDMGVYEDNGLGMPGARKLSLGGKLAPAGPVVDVNSGLASTMVGPGDWLAISADNAIIAFLGETCGTITAMGADTAYQDTAYPLPATAAATLAIIRRIYIEGRA